MPDNSHNNNRIAKNTIFLSIRMVIVLALNLFTTRIVLKTLGVVDYGVYNVVCGFVTMFVFLNTSMSNGIQRFFNYEFGKNGVTGANIVYCTSLYIQAALASLVVILVEFLGLWYLHNKMVIPTDRMVASEWIFQLSVLMLVLGIMQAPYSAAVTAHERMDFYAVISVLEAVLKVGIAFLIMIVPSDRLIMYAILMALVSLINIIIYYFYCKINFKEIYLKPHFDKQMFKSMLGFSGWNLFGSFSGVMKEQGINLVINFYFGPIVNAARGVANQLNGGLQGFVQNITVPVRPQVIQSYAIGDVVRSMRLTYTISKLSCCLLLMVAIPLCLEINYVLELWLGDNIPQHTATFAIIIFLTSIVNNLNSATSGIVHATGKMRDYQLWGSLVSISSVPISHVLLSVYKIPEIALLCVLVCSALGHAICLVVVRKLLGMSLKDYVKEVVFPILIVLLFSLLITSPFHFVFNISNDFIRLCVCAIVCSVSVLLSLYYIGFNRAERQIFIQIANSLLRKIHLPYIGK